MHRSPVLRICIWGLVALVLISVLLFGLSGRSVFSLAGISFNIGSFGTTFHYANADEYNAGATTLSSASISGIDIHWLAGSVTVRVIDGENIVINESAGRSLEQHEVLRYRVKDGTLTIQYCESRSGFQWTNMPSKSMELLIPASLLLRELDIESVSGGVKVEGGAMSISSISVESVSGGVTLRNIESSDLSIETVSGSVVAEGAFGKIDVQSVSGGQTLRLSMLPRSLKMETVSGSLRITLPENDGFTARLDSVSGGLRCDFAQSTGKRAVQYKSGGVAFDLESISGNATIEMDTTLAKPTSEKPAVVKPTVQPTVSPAATDGNVPSGGRKF